MAQGNSGHSKTRPKSSAYWKHGYNYKLEMLNNIELSKTKKEKQKTKMFSNVKEAFKNKK